MSDDLSPMLSQPAEGDNAPMISGRGTKIIADARGAYLAGNLRGLVGHMEADQQAKLRAAILRQGLYYLENALPPSYVSCLQLLREQIEQPFPNLVDYQLHRLAEIGAISYDGARLIYEDARAMSITEFAVTVQSGDLLRIAEAVRGIPINLYWSDRRANPDAEIQKAKGSPQRWQIEAAWAILQGRDAPIIGSFLQGQSAALLAYRRGDLEALVLDLDDDMREYLIRQFIEQTLRARCQLLGVEWSAAIMQPFVILRQRGERTSKQTALADAQRRLLDDHREVASQMALRMDELVLITTSHDLMQIAFWSRTTLTNLMVENDSFREDKSLLMRLHHWQIDAAWAVVHDETPPPLEVLDD